MTESVATGSAWSELPGWVKEARARWPLIGLDEVAFRRHLERVGHSAPVFPLDAYLAAACSAGDAAAVRVLDEELVSRVPDAIRRIDASSAFASEISQQLRIRLLVKEKDDPPRIARYTGEVPLSAWLRVIALRLAFNAKRGPKGVRQSEDDEAAPDMAMEDPEVEFLRGQYRDTFVHAFQGALAELSKDDRTILRLHYVDGVNIDGIGRIFQVHRATVARWLVRIRSDVLGRAKSLLAEHVGAEADEAESVVRALAGEVDFTLSRVLKASAASAQAVP
jgi:RNA polymerase sigma-70 factor, ECF subfamily